MINIEKHIDYWLNSSLEDWEVTIELQRLKKTRHALFFAHLTIEKLLKALICRNTNDLAPRIHNLNRLSEIADIKLNALIKDALAEMNTFNLEGRYPDTSIPPPSIELMNEVIKKTGEIKECLTAMLKKQF